VLATRHRFRQRGCELINHEKELFTPLNVVLTVVPRFATIKAQTAMIKANITPYSTAVGPSSLTKKCCTFRTTSINVNSSSS